MLGYYWFRWMSLGRKLKQIRKKGVLLGQRIKESRPVYLYMMGDFYVEVLYKDNDVKACPERLDIISGLAQLQHYLTDEFRRKYVA